ncbi:hypothetical protein MNBD_ALPHA03-2001 [hydrothermal vent metagenome]|uniref:Ner winged helix-turn-helix DNA-binding domain-containing protein n=1 Tax=hydrothermal vent metagenome TaxID=652676 RepID=A0A3B1B401_9ZZZZ
MSDGVKNNKARIDVLNQDNKFSNKNSSTSLSTQTDWHPAKIKMELEIRGYTLVKLSNEAGYHPSAVGRCLRVSWPSVELVIAQTLGVQPDEIWPSRYMNGIPKSYQVRTRERLDWQKTNPK